jgi:hypothetical protein
MTIKNLTPHPLTLVGENGTLNIQQSGQTARLSVARDTLAPITIDGVVLPVSRPTLGEIVGLPEPEAGVLYVVSALVAERAQRQDVVSVGELLRDEAGRVIGAHGLCAYAERVF